MHADLFSEREDWKKPLWASAILHAVFTVALVVAGYFRGSSGPVWGGTTSGDSVSVSVVNSIPLPPAENQTTNIVANTSPGVTQTRPEPKPVETEDGITIPGKTVPRIEKKPPTPVQPARPNNIPEPPPETAVPFGEGGPVSGPYGVFTADNTKGGFSFQGGGDFGTRFGWYVDVVRRKVRENWPSPFAAQSTRRCYVTFDILRSGQPTNVQLEQSSGIPALDQLAIRAVQRIDTFGPLPTEYSGSKVTVEFWFDYH